MPANPFDLTGKVAIVTGANTGIGQAIALALAAAGADIAAVGRTPAEDTIAKVRALGRRAEIVSADLSTIEPVQRVVDETLGKLGGLDILVNNAGIDLTGAVETLELEDWRRIMAINVDGVFMGTKRFVPLMAESGSAVQGGSSIVNVSSIIEFATKGMPIRANSVHPGFVETPLLKAGFQRWVDKGVAEKPQDLVDAMNAATPMGRLAQPREIAAGIAFLAGPDASYMTGSEMVIDGGWTAQ